MNIFRKLLGRNNESGTPDCAEPAEFRSLLEGSREALRLQTQAHCDSWGLGKSGRWDFDQDSGELVFTFPDKIARAPGQIIGSFNTRENSWLWAWANPSILDAIKRDSMKVRDYGGQHGIRRLTTAKWQGAESDAWDMAALACRLCQSNGAYRGPAGATLIFITFGEVQLTQCS